MKKDKSQKKKNDEKGKAGGDAGSDAGEVMCWKDPTKVCRCDSPQAGVYCGRFPLATD